MNAYQVYLAAFEMGSNIKLAEIAIGSFDNYLAAEAFMENPDSQFLDNVKHAYSFCDDMFPRCVVVMRRRLTETR